MRCTRTRRTVWLRRLYRETVCSEYEKDVIMRYEHAQVTGMPHWCSACSGPQSLDSPALCAMYALVTTQKGCYGQDYSEEK